MLLSQDELNKILEQIPSEDDYMPGLAIDCIIFGYHNRELKVLLTRQEELSKWYLPTGHIKKDEGINEAAYRILKQRTGVTNLFLKHYQTFGDPNRTFQDDQLAAELNKLPAEIIKK